MQANHVGRRSSYSVGALGAIYAVALGAGIATCVLSTPIADPILRVMELLTMLSAVALTVVVASIAGIALTERRVFATLSLAFAALFAGVTFVVHRSC